MSQKIRIQDDLYLAVNGDWQEKAVIPDDKVQIGADSDLSDDIRETLVKDLKKLDQTAEGPDDDHALKTAARFFTKANDFKTRDRLDFQPAAARLAFLKELTTFTQFQDHLYDLVKGDYALPFEFYVDSDFNDAKNYALLLSGPSLILPDAALYRDLTDEAKKWLVIWQQMARSVLEKAGFPAAESANLVDDAMAFDRRIAAYLPTNVELADEHTYNNPCDWSDFVALTQATHLSDVLSTLAGKTPDHVILASKAYFEQLNQLITPENYHEWYAMALIQELLQDGQYLSDDWRILVGTYQRTLYHQKAPVSQVKQAYQITNRFFADPIGVYYGKTYFGEKAKADITGMVHEIIAQYQRQLQENTWLSETTKKKALRKLDTMVIKMGYPDHPFSLYETFDVQKDDDLLTAVTALAKKTNDFWLPRIGEPVDRSQWAMPGHLVNACYNPSTNDITFPAGILQPPFYAYTWTRAQKLGGTGVTIGHEISHAFDNNGSLFDEFGTMKNWWTADDRKAFEKVIAAMEAQFDGQEYEGTKVNGKLAVSENLADNAGMAVTLDLLKKASIADLKDFFKAYAVSWRTKMRPEYAKAVLMRDVHAPATLRVNIPVQNFDAWYQTYEVKPGDQLYLSPEKRVHIWNY